MLAAVILRLCGCGFKELKMRAKIKFIRQEGGLKLTIGKIYDGWLNINKWHVWEDDNPFGRRYIQVSQDQFEVVKVAKEFSDFYPDHSDQEFVMAQGITDYILPVSVDEHKQMATIMASEEAIYITREQARKLFGFRKDKQLQ